jgi:prolyl-tRNA synthetase
MMGDGKALQAGTSHDLGQNFARAFDVHYLSAEGKEEFVWATSWGVSTRLVGAVVMGHGDDQGLILPPRLAPIQVVVVPIYKGDAERRIVLDACARLTIAMKDAGVRYHVDDRDQYRPGWKFNHWEMKGVPVRIELGPRDLASGEARVSLRHSGEKRQERREGLAARLPATLEDVQRGLYAKALAFRDANTHSIDDYGEFRERIDAGGFFLAHWDGTGETEERIKQDTKATIRCIPFDAPEEAGKCLVTGKPSRRRVLIAKAY